MILIPSSETVIVQLGSKPTTFISESNYDYLLQECRLEKEDETKTLERVRRDSGENVLYFQSNSAGSSMHAPAPPQRAVRFRSRLPLVDPTTIVYDCPPKKLGGGTFGDVYKSKDNSYPGGSAFQRRFRPVISHTPLSFVFT